MPELTEQEELLEQARELARRLPRGELEELERAEELARKEV